MSLFCGEDEGSAASGDGFQAALAPGQRQEDTAVQRSLGVAYDIALQTNRKAAVLGGAFLRARFLRVLRRGRDGMCL